MASLTTKLAARPSNSPLLMGVLNVTPDSFFDGGQFDTTEKALEQARHLVASGADIIDIGGESTRPYAKPLPLEIELERVIPVIECITAQLDVAVSIDTYKPQVMQAAVNAGASMINDIKALQEPGALSVAAQLDVPICLMHMQGTPEKMQDNPRYGKILTEVMHFFESRINACTAMGMCRDRLILDPGFGFGKTLEHNYMLLAQLQALQQYELPILAGVSNKSMIGEVTKKPAGERLIGSVTASLLAWQQGARIIRIHDVASMYEAVKVTEMYNKFGRGI